MAIAARHGGDLPFTVVPPAEAAGAAGAIDAQDALRAEGRSYRTRFLFGTVLTAPDVLLTMVVRHIPAAHERLRESVTDTAALPLIDVFAWALATPVQFSEATGLYRGAYYAAKQGRSTMDTLITLGTSTGYGFSVFVVVLNVVRLVRGGGAGGDGVAPPTEATVFETAALLIMVVLFGKWPEALAQGRAAAGVAALERLTLQTATVFYGGTILAEGVPVALLLPGIRSASCPARAFPSTWRWSACRTAAAAAATATAATVTAAARL